MCSLDFGSIGSLRSRERDESRHDLHEYLFEVNKNHPLSNLIRKAVKQEIYSIVLRKVLPGTLSETPPVGAVWGIGFVFGIEPGSFHGVAFPEIVFEEMGDGSGFALPRFDFPLADGVAAEPGSFVEKMFDRSRRQPVFAGALGRFMFALITGGFPFP